MISIARNKGIAKIFEIRRQRRRRVGRENNELNGVKRTSLLLRHIERERIGVCVGLRIEMVVGAGHGKSRALVDRADKRNKTVENQYKLLNLQKINLDSVTKQAASDHSQKSASSIKVATERALSPGEARSSAVIKAESVRSKLESKFPSFVKSLVRSHVAGCFWMGLPALFCKRYLPDKDVTITLEDESGKEYQSKYIAYKTGLSAGWRQFSAVHKLQEGDVLVFQLVQPTKFKVLIIRANDLSELDGALSHMNLDSHAKRKEKGKPCILDSSDIHECSLQNNLNMKVMKSVQKYWRVLQQEALNSVM
ncbi:B3 domain-containing protein [Senna tora]|uniref:B3 domain-containing protein n=1 Tax=Senna tora TaxID=362788 RepID=A0A834TUC1_9FABA|nr:B3 domain-containing protein [Senna tora]